MIEQLQDLIDRLALERQRLREQDASRFELEANRMRIVRAQADLSHAFVERYGRRAA